MKKNNFHKYGFRIVLIFLFFINIFSLVLDVNAEIVGVSLDEFKISFNSEVLFENFEFNQDLEFIKISNDDKIKFDFLLSEKSDFEFYILNGLDEEVKRSDSKTEDDDFYRSWTLGEEIISGNYSLIFRWDLVNESYLNEKNLSIKIITEEDLLNEALDQIKKTRLNLENINNLEYIENDEISFDVSVNYSELSDREKNLLENYLVDSKIIFDEKLNEEVIVEFYYNRNLVANFTKDFLENKTEFYLSEVVFEGFPIRPSISNENSAIWSIKIKNLKGDYNISFKSVVSNNNFETFVELDNIEILIKEFLLEDALDEIEKTKLNLKNINNLEYYFGDEISFNINVNYSNLEDKEKILLENYLVDSKIIFDNELNNDSRLYFYYGKNLVSNFTKDFLENKTEFYLSEVMFEEFPIRASVSNEKNVVWRVVVENLKGSYNVNFKSVISNDNFETFIELDNIEILIKEKSIDGYIDELLKIENAGNLTNNYTILIEKDIDISKNNMSLIIENGTNFSYISLNKSNFIFERIDNLTSIIPLISSGKELSKKIFGIKVGFENQDIKLSKPVKIIFENSNSNYLVGFVKSDNIFRKITNICINETINLNQNECFYFDNNTNQTIVLTKHFTEFITYTEKDKKKSISSGSSRRKSSLINSFDENIEEYKVKVLENVQDEDIGKNEILENEIVTKEIKKNLIVESYSNDTINNDIKEDNRKYEITGFITKNTQTIIGSLISFLVVLEIVIFVLGKDKELKSYKPKKKKDDKNKSQH